MNSQNATPRPHLRKDQTRPFQPATPDSLDDSWNMFLAFDDEFNAFCDEEEGQFLLPKSCETADTASRASFLLGLSNNELDALSNTLIDQRASTPEPATPSVSNRVPSFYPVPDADASIEHSFGLCRSISDHDLMQIAVRSDCHPSLCLPSKEEHVSSILDPIDLFFGSHQDEGTCAEAGDLLRLFTEDAPSLASRKRKVEESTKQHTKVSPRCASRLISYDFPSPTPAVKKPRLVPPSPASLPGTDETENMGFVSIDYSNANVNTSQPAIVLDDMSSTGSVHDHKDTHHIYKISSSMLDDKKYRASERKVNSKGKERTRFRQYQAEQWTARLSEAIQFVAKHGHCSIPHCYETNPELARWAKRQRYQYKLFMQGGDYRRKSSMTQERINALDKLGFCWDAHRETWQLRYEELVLFKDAQGHCNVPATFPENPQLATWVKCQRRQHKLLKMGEPSNMTEERLACLEKIGFQWDLSQQR